jgi:hypothetical protein
MIHQKVKSFAYQIIENKEGTKLQKLTTLPVPRWSPTLVLGKPVGA